MKPLYQTLLRPQPEHERHWLELIVQNNAAAPFWSNLIEINTGRSSSPVFYLWRLPSPILPSRAAIQQHSNEHSELIVPLAQGTGSVTFEDLSQTPLEDWIRTLNRRLAVAPSAVAVLVLSGQISVMLSQGGAV